MYSTTVSRHIAAPRDVIYRALLDADAIATWRTPDGMTGHVHEFEAREGGRFRVSLSYVDEAGAGKSGAHTDTYRGRFVTLVAGERVVEELAFESDDPALGGVMTMTTTLADSGGGTEVTIVHEGVPDVVPPADNEVGTRMALDNLARFVGA
ncbi:SRPBCC family protein [Catenuloplanes atrovinosus]|uniref:Uncharacterized protein YndB with AHSA1/START domain n=1 Tax=Catenuloplanes atrovinosus TaxID=137266 RepID=A0AAE4CC95_9ACTN|nr:SRPBCC family protein [Catenuloplanes atrovinosus]MDR7276315.1 uncharacterized protein YndB with AHSA1/START domain [Catenuloplanes atrovinosus]